MAPIRRRACMRRGRGPATRATERNSHHQPKSFVKFSTWQLFWSILQLRPRQGCRTLTDSSLEIVCSMPMGTSRRCRSRARQDPGMVPPSTARHTGVQGTWLATHSFPRRLIRNARLVGFPASTHFRRCCGWRSARRRAQDGVHIVIGNAMATLNYERILRQRDCFDYVVVGDGRGE